MSQDEYKVSFTDEDGINKHQVFSDEESAEMFYLWAMNYKPFTDVEIIKATEPA